MRRAGTYLGQMAAMVAAAVVLGLGANFFSSDRLPLLRPLPKEADAAPAFGEVDADFVAQAAAAPGTVLLDARIGAAFRLGHIRGALSLPLADFEAAFARLEGNLRQAGLLVVYCSDITCSDSRNLAAKLWARGLKNLLLYRGGIEDWTAKGHDVEK